MWEQLSFSTGYIPDRMGRCVGLPATQAAPDRALSLASQLPLRSLQPVGVDMAAQAACGSNCLFLLGTYPTVWADVWAYPRRRRRLTGPYRWQAPTQISAACRCRHGCASSLWERACPRWRQLPRHSFLQGPFGRHWVCRASEVSGFPSADPRTLLHHGRCISRHSRPQGWNAPMKIAGSTRASFRLTFQCMCGPVARPVEPTRPTTSPRRRSWPFFTSIRDRWQNMLMNPWP